MKISYWKTILIVLMLGGCSSQPRFVHHGGEPELMFDNTTAQECWAGPVQKDNGIAALDKANENLQEANKMMQKATVRDSDALAEQVNLATNVVLSASARVDRLHEHPEEQKVIQVHGLHYCSDLK